jgi:hypothetical protein
MAGWNSDTAAGPLGLTLTLVEGANFCLSSTNGDIFPEQPHGLFSEDTRILPRWVLTVDGQLGEPLAAETQEPYRVISPGACRMLTGPGTALLLWRGRGKWAPVFGSASQSATIQGNRLNVWWP